MKKVGNFFPISIIFMNTNTKIGGGGSCNRTYPSTIPHERYRTIMFRNVGTGKHDVFTL